MGLAQTPTELSTDLLFLLGQASHALQTEVTARLEKIGIGPRQFCVLQSAQSGEHTQIRLAEMCALDKTTMVVTVDALEKAGLAERKPSATDRRARVIKVTEAGEQAVKDARVVINDVYDGVLGSLPAAERDALVGGLQRLVFGGALSEPAVCEQSTVRRRKGS